MNTGKSELTSYLDVDGATCSSCVYTIEHLGRRIKGVKDVYVNRKTGQIEMSHDGDAAAVSKMVEIVGKIGYTAVPAESSEDHGILKPLHSADKEPNPSF